MEPMSPRSVRNYRAGQQWNELGIPRYYRDIEGNVATLLEVDGHGNVLRRDI